MTDPVRLVRCSCGKPAEEHLTHYVVVRRDLPLGVVLAQVVHAAGESFYKLAEVAQNGAASPRAEQRVLNPQVAGSTPALGSFNPSETYAVVLGARNEGKLLKLERALVAASVPHVAVREPDAPYDGQLMSIGIVPARKQDVARYVADFHMLRELEVKAFVCGKPLDLGPGGY